MKKILVYSLSLYGNEEAMALQEAKKHCEKGDIVWYLSCDKTLKGCQHNALFCESQCVMCSLMQQKRLKKLLPPGVIQKKLSDFFDISLDERLRKIKFEYISIPDLKSIRYKDVNIGYAALSTYISATRNLDVIFQGEVKRYIDMLLLHQVRLTEIIIKVLNELNPDCVYFFNGRFAQYRPLLDLSKHRGIDYVATENIFFPPNHVRRNLFFNSIPHDMDAFVRKAEAMWNECKDVKEREELGRKFFTNRRNAIFSGDRNIYVEKQEKGLMPQGWDVKQENIVIFNSSEDEFCAINEKVDRERLFSSQIEGIKRIVEHYSTDVNKHFWLRVHPNLTGISFHYHQDLYKLNYSNLTVIPSDSPISTYGLIDASSKVIVFGSSTGIEATYWGKPVICLVYSFYNALNVVHVPQDEDELWSLINDPHLPCLNNENVLKYGFYIMSGSKFEDNKDFPMDYKTYGLLGKEIKVSNYRNYYFKSRFLTGLFELIGWEIGKWMKVNRDFKKIPLF